MDYGDCRDAIVLYWRNTDGTLFERFKLNDHYFDNEIASLETASKTNPAKIFYDRGECSVPRHEIRETSQVLIEPTPQKTPDQNVAANVASLLFLVALIAGAYWLYIRGQKERGGATPGYHPHADLPRLPRLSELAGLAAVAYEQESNQTPRIRGEFDPSSTANSTEFESNSTSNSTPEEPGPVWPPKSPEPLYNPLEPERQNEFDDYRRLIEKNGLSPRGNDIVFLMWGVKPGNSNRYHAAVRKRDQFARRLEYYRYEGA